jgi:hypothetical protein
VLLFASLARAQEPAAPATDERAALEKKANDLLLSVAGQIGSLRSAENRARIGSNAAEALWKVDEKRARSLFAAVAEDIRTGFSDSDPDFERHNQRLLVFWQLRSDTLARIAQHDPELALEFLRSTRRPADEKMPFGTMDTENAQELRLAGQVAAKNPELALKLANESLEKGFSPDLMEMLKTLSSTDKGASGTLFQAIVDKLKTAEVGENNAATQFAFSLAEEFPPPQSDARVYRDLIGMLLTAVLTKGCGKESDTEEVPDICYRVGSIFPTIEKYYGPRAASLKRWAPEPEDAEAQQAGGYWLKMRELGEKGTVEEILAFAEKNPDSKFELYWAAFKKAEVSADFDKARKLAAEFPEGDQREAMLAEINLIEKRRLADPGNPDSIQRALSTFRSDDDRLQFLMSTAARAIPTDRKMALQVLNQARPFVDSMRGKAQLQGQVSLALLYCSLKSDRGFEIVESMIPRLNQLVTAAATLDGVETTYLADEEWNMTGAGELGGLLTVLAQNAGWFGRLDFDRSVSIANQLERPELRLMTELKIAQGVLVEPPSIPQLFLVTERYETFRE